MGLTSYTHICVCFHIVYPTCRVSELVAQHEAQRQEDMLALQEKEKRITELEQELTLKAQEEQKLELQRQVCLELGLSQL